MYNNAYYRIVPPQIHSHSNILEFLIIEQVLRGAKCAGKPTNKCSVEQSLLHSRQTKKMQLDWIQ